MMEEIERVQVTYVGVISSVFLYVCGWSALYILLCKLNPKRSGEWHCRTVTAIHATTVTSLGFYCNFIQGPLVFVDSGGPSTPMQQFTCELCLGFFFFDFIWCIYYEYFKTEGFVIFLHHFLSIIGIGVTCLRGFYGTEMTATIAGSEVTNPLLQLRWFLKEIGQYNTLTGDIVDILFMTIFGFFRIFLGTILLYSYYQNPDTDYFGRIGGTSIYAVGWLFWFSIVKFAIKKYTRKFKKSQKDNSMKFKNTEENGNHVDAVNGEVVHGGHSKTE